MNAVYLRRRQARNDGEYFVRNHDLADFILFMDDMSASAFRLFTHLKTSCSTFVDRYFYP